MLLVCMSIAGTIPALICCIIWAAQRKNFSYSLGKKLVLTSMAFYLVPVQLVKYLLPKEAVQYLNAYSPSDSFIRYQEGMISFKSGTDLLWIPKWAVVTETIWFVLIILFALFEVSQYLYRIRRLKNRSKETIIETENMGKMEVHVSRNISAPYTAGFLHAFIVYPEKLLNHEAAEMILKHEATHKRNHDSLLKLLGLAVICLHWFNPLALLPLILYNIFSEFIADEEAVSGCSREQCKTYLKAMIELSSDQEKMPIVWKNSFLGEERILKRRMEHTMKKNSNGKPRKVATAAAILISALLSATTVLAYTPLQKTGGENEALPLEHPDIEFSKDPSSAELDFSEATALFVDINGNVTPVYDFGIEPNALCIHDFESGTVRAHEPNDSGGCTIYAYDAKRCVKCNYLIINELLYTTIYVKCPHNS